MAQPRHEAWPFKIKELVLSRVPNYLVFPVSRCRSVDPSPLPVGPGARFRPRFCSLRLNSAVISDSQPDPLLKLSTIPSSHT